jgi:hypothetical protein
LDRISTYLARHAEPEAKAAEALEGSFGHVLQVPAYAEGEDLFAMLGSVPAGPRGRVMIVLVLNARADSPPAVHAANEVVRRRLAAAATAAAPLSSDPSITACAFAHGSVILIDRAAPGRFLPEGQGIGLARKIGCDFALAAAASGHLAADWLHCTDADVLLPNDYFEQTEAIAASGLAAAVYFYRHRFDPDEALGQAGRLYEISLRYGVLGLAWAGSPYAYEAMGSCIAVRPGAYAAIGGFPKANALEDVRALNRLAREGGIARLSGTPVQLSGRISKRVRVSTGQALSKLAEKPRARDAFRLDHPAVYAHLAAWLGVLEALAISGEAEASIRTLPSESPFFRPALLTESLERLGALAAAHAAAARGKTEADRRHFLHTGFDALKTRKLLEALRAGGLPPLPWRRALAEAPFTGLSTSTEDDPDVLVALLAAEERRLSTSLAGLPAPAAGRP